MDDLELLERGTILHWQFTHFVVLDRVRSDSIEIVDPAIGRRRVSIDEFSDSFTGVALMFEPGDDFRAEKQRKSGMWPFVRRLVGEHKGVLAQVVITSLFLQIVALSVPLLTSLVVDRVLPRGDQHLLMVVAVGLFGVVVFQFAAAFLRAHLLLALRIRLDARMMLAFLPDPLCRRLDDAAELERPGARDRHRRRTVRPARRVAGHSLPRHSVRG
jgi:ABC-type bacteriocin/lantibiotic exporter with double-glycine peptidase domain